MSRNKIAVFESISITQLVRDIEMFHIDAGDADAAVRMLDDVVMNIHSPERATKGSAGYDICSPVDLDLEPGIVYSIGTGLRAVMREDYVLMIYPRSGLASKYGMRFVNTIPVIDSDYSEANNEGHIILKVTVDKPMSIHAGDRIAQGVFLPFGITINDSAEGNRTGGFGSTGVQ